MHPISSENWQIVLMGVVICFTVLALVAGMVKLISHMDERWQKGEAKEDIEAFDRPQNIDNTTLVLISAAVATMFQGRAHIRSISRITPSENSASPWSMAGRTQIQGSHHPHTSKRTAL